MKKLVSLVLALCLLLSVAVVAQAEGKTVINVYRCTFNLAQPDEAQVKKVEDAIKKIDGVVDAKVNFMMQKFTLEALDADFDRILDEAVAVGKKIEPDFSVER